MQISIIITSYNEGPEVAATVESVRNNTNDCEIILVDDASTDESCSDDLRIDRCIRHDKRLGIVPSRRDGVAAADGDCFVFLDAHQRVIEDTLNKCAAIAIERQAITYPDVYGFAHPERALHGAVLGQAAAKDRFGLFDGTWRRRTPRDPISRCTTMIVPPYVIPRSLFLKVEWPYGMENFGASEPAISVRAFFADVDILHVCGPQATHFFKGGHGAGYSCSFAREVCNHAIVARTCFSDRTWCDYWRPQVFDRWLSADCLRWFDEEIAVSQQHAFQQIKQRPDTEFWRGLLHQPVPRGVSDA